MKKVFQRRVHQGDGDCMQAVVASLFELELDEVPDFIRIKHWFSIMHSFYHAEGFDLTLFNVQREDKDLVKEIMHYDGGINGFFDATVKSQTFKDGTHAVVVDVDLNIVHDPNPNQLALKLKPEDVISITTVKGEWYISVDGKLIKEKYDSSKD